MSRDGTRTLPPPTLVISSLGQERASRQADPDPLSHTETAVNTYHLTVEHFSNVVATALERLGQCEVRLGASCTLQTQGMRTR